MTQTKPDPTPKGRKTSQLRNLLRSGGLEFILEAHNGLSARIVEEAGFNGIWASGLALSAQFGVRDNNEASWTQVVDMVEFMADVTSIPILLDGDTGYGNFNNMRRLVRKLEQRGVAGVCVEDKLFPKTNSFIDGERQELADIVEFCGKIAAGKDSQTDDDFCVVARVEAYIAGWDTAEALRRAEAYRKAGADGILIHSAWSRPDQILEFAREWAARAPLVIVPTKYYSTPTEAYREAQVSLVIWANHLIRSAASAMQDTARRIHEQQSLVEVEDQIASVKEIFRLQGADELAEAERRYFLDNRRAARAIVLAASRGDEFAELTDDRPKVMLPVNGRPLLQRLIESCKRAHIDNVTVVAGYKADRIEAPAIELVVNDAYASTGELVSLACAQQRFGDDVVILYGDLMFRGYVLRSLAECEHELAIVVDSQAAGRESSGVPDFAYCSAADDRSLWEQDVLLEKLTRNASDGTRQADGRWIGMLRAHGQGVRELSAALDALGTHKDFATLGMRDIINYLISNGQRIHVIYIHGHWLDINSLRDLERAGQFSRGQR
ncbi:MAG: phosphoenolpyruvate mutase [Gammaproteobacteria bacterium]